ncbi:MAG: DoxX family protein [Planctomycetota bacterium]|nr:DoxX family protein [Planctomycetota bacterium]
MSSSVTPTASAHSPSSAPGSLIRKVRAVGLSLADKVAWLAPLLARVVVGLVFVWSGWGKLHNIDGVVKYFTELGIPAPEIQAPFAATMEFACGLLIVAGLFTRLAAIPLIVIMIVAIKTAFAQQLGDAVGAKEWLNTLFGLSEFLYIVLLAWLAIAGAGRVSLDHLIFGRRRN